MSEERDKSAIDAIYEILDKISSIEKRIELLDSNMKIVMNRLQSSVDKKVTAIAPQTSQESAVLNTNAVDRKNDVRDDGMIKVFGKIKNKELKPVPNVMVKIFDSNNALIKKRNTNDSGMWEVRLPNGKYNVEYDFSNISKKVKNIYIPIEINKSMTVFEVK